MIKRGGRYKIPLFDLNFGREEERAVLEALRSRWVSMGPRVAEFESRFKAMIAAKHAVAVTNCTAALHLALRILGIKSGDEVIVPALTFVATVNAIRYVGARPVFCDIASDEDLNIDPRLLACLVTKRTKAIMVMHYGGFPCDMDPIMAVARRHGLKVVEDACHAPLSQYKGRALGTIGDAGCFSFFSNKNISIGEGGMLVSNSEEFTRKARLLRSHGMTSLSYERSLGHASSYDVVDLGYNFRLDDLRAAVGIAQLAKLRGDLGLRALVRRRYLERLRSVEGVLVPFGKHRGFVSNHIFPVILEGASPRRRQAVRDALHADGVETSVHYPAAHRFSIYRRYSTSLPKTERVADSLITLPMYGSLALGSVDYVVERLKAHLK